MFVASSDQHHTDQRPPRQSRQNILILPTHHLEGIGEELFSSILLAVIQDHHGVTGKTCHGTERPGDMTGTDDDQFAELPDGFGEGNSGALDIQFKAGLAPLSKMRTHGKISTNLAQLPETRLHIGPFGLPEP